MNGRGRWGRDCILIIINNNVNSNTYTNLIRMPMDQYPMFVCQTFITGVIK